MRALLDLHSLDDRNSLRSWLETTRNQESGHLAICGELAKTSGIMALAVKFGSPARPDALMEALNLKHEHMWSIGTMRLRSRRMHWGCAGALTLQPLSLPHRSLLTFPAVFPT